MCESCEFVWNEECMEGGICVGEWACIADFIPQTNN